MALAALCAAGLAVSGGAFAQDTSLTPTSRQFSCDALYAVNSYGVNGTNAAQTTRGAYKIYDGSVLSTPELMYQAVTPGNTNWGFKGAESTIALGRWGGTGELTMYSWAFDSNTNQYIHWVQNASASAGRTPTSFTEYLAGSTTGPGNWYAGGEVYQKTGMIYMIGPMGGNMTNGRVRVFDPTNGAYVDSGEWVPTSADNTLTGTVQVQGDMAFDAEGNIYTIVGRGMANATLIRIVPPAIDTGTGFPGAGAWKYDIVANVGFTLSNNLYGMAFLNGSLFASVGSSVSEINVYSGAVDSTITVPWTVYDLASCQTAPVVKGTIYHDQNGDGSINGDPGLEGAVVELYKNGEYKATRTTSSTGEYSFILDETQGTFSIRVRRPQVTVNGGKVNAAQSYASAGGLLNQVRPRCANGAIATSGMCAGARGGGEDPDNNTSLTDAQYVTDIIMNSDGEVAEVNFGFTVTRDFGDAPDKFGTLIASNGPQHWANAASLVRMGESASRSSVSGTADGNPSAAADSATTDDGVKVKLTGSDTPQPLQNVVLISGKTYNFTVDVQGSVPDLGNLNSWITWTDTENFATRMHAADKTGSGGQITFGYQVPASSASAGMTPIFARFRMSTSTGLGPKATSSDAGWVQDGEVEDYKLNVAPGALRLGVKSESGTGEFRYTMTNISTNSPSTANQTLETTTAGTTVWQGVNEYHVFGTLGQAIVITQEMPTTDWNLSSVTCTASIGDNAATPLTVGIDKTNNKVTIDASAVVDDAEIACEFVNSMGASLKMVKTIDAEPLLVGKPFNYTFTIQNGSTVVADKITFSDLLPSNISVTSLPSNFTCTYGGVSVGASSFPLVGNDAKILTCVVAVAIEGNGSAVISLPSVPTAVTTTPPTNTATWLPEGGEGTPETPVRHCPTPLQAGVNCTEVTANNNVGLLQVEKSIPADQQPLIVGRNFNYQFKVINNTSETLTQIVLSDLVPNGITIVSVPGNVTCDQTPEWTGTGSAVMTCTASSLSIAPAGEAIITIQARPEAVTAGTRPINTVTWTPNGTGVPETPITGCPAQLLPYCDEDGGPSGNVQSAGIATVKELTDTNGNVITTMQVGVPSLYRIRIRNTGTVATIAPIMTIDTIDATLTIDTMSSGCLGTGLTVKCTTPAGLAANAEAVYTIQVTPTAVTAAGTNGITNTAKSYGGGDPNCASETETCDGSIGPTQVVGAHLKTSKTVTPALQVGSVSTYRIRVENTGDGATTAEVKTTDEIDATLTIGTVSSGCSVSGRTVTCTTPLGLAGGAFVDYEIQVTPTVANA
ncbi:MAG: DUF11 domain-containing protein, partial [Xanthomonadaceae bacterium]|nr:DUF11 domain-containing protein [Xanthomonadaceae bacterium]